MQTTGMTGSNTLDPPGHPSAAEWHQLACGDHAEPHRLLGAHPSVGGNSGGIVIRAFHPDAIGVELLPAGGAAMAMGAGDAPGLFHVCLSTLTPPAYRLRFRFSDGAVWERDDPYRFLPTIGDMDLYLFNEGTHRRLWQMLGARPLTVGEVDGVSFSVWAPHARRVSVIGDFCHWDGRLFPMRRLGASGVFELFVPGVKPGALYKFEIKTQHGELRIKSDPMARHMELPPGSASRVTDSHYAWNDAGWRKQRATLPANRSTSTRSTSPRGVGCPRITTAGSAIARSPDRWPSMSGGSVSRT
jgi:1,4-alpha-glucan branching enzyme